MSYEDKLLLYLACTSVNERLLQKVKDILSTGLDWNYVIGKAIHNGIVPILYQNLHMLATTELRNPIPQRVLEKFRELNYSVIGHGMVLHEEVRKIFKSLKAGGINFTPIKGVLLAETVYPEKHLRFFGDIDLLFPNRQEFEKAGKLLLNLGYHAHPRAREPFGCHFIKNQHGLSISCDLHHFLPGWSDFYPYPSIPDIWDASLTKTIEGVPIPIMTPENMFLVLSLHSFRNSTFTLRDLCDAMELLKKFPRFDWSLIIDYAQQEPWRHILLMFLCLFSYATEVLEENPLPRGLLEKINRGFLNLPIDKNIQFPVPYIFLCRSYGKLKHCPVVLREKVKKAQNLPKRIIRAALIYFWESILLFKFVRPIRMLLRCYYSLNKYYLSRSIISIARVL